MKVCNTSEPKLREMRLECLRQEGFGPEPTVNLIICDNADTDPPNERCETQIYLPLEMANQLSDLIRHLTSD